jgi:hypothetical protein
LRSRQHFAVSSIHALRLGRGRDAESAIVLDEAIRWVVWYIRAEIGIEAQRDRASCNSMIKGDFAVRARPVPAEVPLSDARSGIAAGFEHAGQCEPTGRDQGRIVRAEDAALQAGSPGVTAGEDTVAGGAANSGATMSASVNVMPSVASRSMRGVVRRPRWGFRKWTSPKPRSSAKMSTIFGWRGGFGTASLEHAASAPARQKSLRGIAAIRCLNPLRLAVRLYHLSQMGENTTELVVRQVLSMGVGASRCRTNRPPL